MASAERPTFGELLLRLRVHAGLTQEALAERAGLSPETVSSLERGTRRAPYRETVRLLGEALGLGADERTALAAAATRRRTHTPAAEVTTRAPASAGSNEAALPATLTSFVGRERELAVVATLLAGGRRLITLTGPGGVGKTRLAIETARRVAPTVSGDVWFADLTRLTEPQLVPQAVATLLGVRDARGRSFTESLVAALRDRSVLIVLDNCEHVLAAAAELASALLRDCPRVMLLATSREPLHVAGEQLAAVPPLAVSTDGAESDPALSVESAAVRLFVDRARAVRPDFPASGTGSSAIGAICRRLDGLPLAIELVAAQVRVLAPEQILSRLGSRLRTVVAQARDTEPRHRTLRALIDWSYDLLTQPERVLLRRLAVFTGGCDLEAIEAVCSDSTLEVAALLPVLTALVDKSLVVAELQPGAMRYRMLESIHEYAAEQLESAGEEPLLRRRHRDYYLALAQQLDTGADDWASAAGVPRVTEEFANLRAAFAWSLTAGQAPEAALKLPVALWWYWPHQVFLTEGRDWFGRALAAAGDAEPLLRARALHHIGILSFLEQDYANGLVASRESIALARQHGDGTALVRALRSLALNEVSLGDAEGARAHLEEALPLARVGVEPAWLPYVLESLGFVLFNQGQPQVARPYLEEAITTAAAANVGIVVASGHLYLGFCCLLEGGVAEAGANYRTALTVANRLGHQTHMAMVIVALALLAAVERRLTHSTRLMGVWLALSGRLGINAPPAQRVQIERRLEKLRQVLGEETFEGLLTAGRSLRLEDAVALALSEPTVDATP